MHIARYVEGHPKSDGQHQDNRVDQGAVCAHVLTGWARDDSGRAKSGPIAN